MVTCEDDVYESLYHCRQETKAQFTTIGKRLKHLSLVSYHVRLDLLCHAGLVRGKTIPGCLEIQETLESFYPLSSEVQVLQLALAAKRAWYRINFRGLQLYRNEARTNPNYRICTS